MTSHHHARC